jgi:hypothetical protein
MFSSRVLTLLYKMVKLLLKLVCKCPAYGTKETTAIITNKLMEKKSSSFVEEDKIAKPWLEISSSAYDYKSCIQSLEQFDDSIIRQAVFF